MIDVENGIKVIPDSKADSMYVLINDVLIETSEILIVDNYPHSV